MNTLAFENIILETKTDKKFPIKYLTELYSYNMNFILPVKSNSPLSAIKCFYPLPTKLLLSETYSGPHKIIKNKNEYQFHGNPGKRIIFADKKLPFVSDKLKYPIPFSFPISTEFDVEIIASNVYYFEINLLDKQNKEPWEGECVSIGFGNNNIEINSHVGWYNDSIGFHSDDGTIRFNDSTSYTKIYTEPWQPGDIAGAGIIYVGKNEIKPFFTFNGKLIYMSGKTIKMKTPYFPVIGFDHSHSISVNFSTKPFVYNIKNLILKNSDYVISTENSFITNYDIGYILNEPPIFPKYNKLSYSIINIVDANGNTTGLKLVPNNFTNTQEDYSTNQTNNSSNDFELLNEPFLSLTNNIPDNLIDLIKYPGEQVNINNQVKTNTEHNEQVHPQIISLSTPQYDDMYLNNFIVEGQNVYSFANTTNTTNTTNTAYTTNTTNTANTTNTTNTAYTTNTTNTANTLVQPINSVDSTNITLENNSNEHDDE